MTAAPLPWVFEGDGVLRAPSARYAERAAQAFTKGEWYFLVEHKERSIKTHNHYFASLTEAWMNLPEAEALKFPDVETLRKRALIMTGWRTETVVVADSREDAMRLGALVKTLDEYAAIIVRDSTVTILRAKSQSRRAMGAKDFQQSKDDVLAWSWALVDVPADVGKRETGRAA